MPVPGCMRRHTHTCRCTHTCILPHLYLYLGVCIWMHMRADVHIQLKYRYMGVCMYIHICTQHLETREAFVSNLNCKRQDGRHVKLHAYTYLYLRLYLYLGMWVFIHTYLYVYVQCLQTKKIIIPKTHTKTQRQKSKWPPRQACQLHKVCTYLTYAYAQVGTCTCTCVQMYTYMHQYLYLSACMYVHICTMYTAPENRRNLLIKHQCQKAKWPPC